ncbi:nucleotidyltransferase family protein [Cyanobacterium stanieri LEGE 03274]|uniref:Nucleotidyltransferase family protein n=1 Tax=Cyanobacterium stanieri LEGE 03274 TaxID=1828756 RepID=A0ABR9VAB8_9CHRO|nr:nucleotidyltransferase family protein [Cyanobacterium stanieri]MBE9223789.1 nucleotidyltransferase family protein [Cyanobacterium stanieri LEGE 03274]
MNNIDKILDTNIKQKILTICAKYGAFNVKVFGSYARGEATEDSDLDLLMDIEKGKSLLNRIALKQELEDLLGIKVDIAKPNNLHETIKNQVLAEAILL